MYKNDGSSVSGPTSPGSTSCGIAITSIGPPSPSTPSSAHAKTLFVVPRSMPTLNRASCDWAAAIALRHFDFGLSDDPAGGRDGQRRQLDARRAPAAMQQRAAEWWMARRVSD